MNILVIHGFNSGPGNKSKTLQDAFPQATIYSPQLNNKPIEDINTLQSFIENNKNIHVVGTSLGGFYTMYLAIMNNDRDDLSFYIVNPSYTPYENFASKLNQTFQNYKTNQSFTVSENFLNELDTLQFHLHELFTVYPNMYFYIGKNDIILNHKPLLNNIYSFFKPVNVFMSEQDHRHDDISEIIKQIQENSIL
jgi:predicted esterase YcpF (UPF0227 family)